MDTDWFSLTFSDLTSGSIPGGVRTASPGEDTPRWLVLSDVQQGPQPTEKSHTSEVDVNIPHLEPKDRRQYN
jgi:hypothetical protein